MTDYMKWLTFIRRLVPCFTDILPILLIIRSGGLLHTLAVFLSSQTFRSVDEIIQIILIVVVAASLLSILLVFVLLASSLRDHQLTVRISLKVVLDAALSPGLSAL